MKLRVVLIVVSVLCSLSPVLSAQDASPEPSAASLEAIRLAKVATAVRIDEPIVVNGRLDEPAWERAESVSEFYQWEPNNGALESERTEVRFLYDAENLYVAFRCFDSKIDELIVTELREDFSGTESDGILLLLDTLHDRSSAFGFGTNPAGAKRDLQLANDGGQLNFDWDGVWDVKVSRNDDGWSAEYVIPFKTLRFSSESTQEWGLNMLRRVRRLNEESHWSPVPRRGRARISFAGTLRGLEGIRQGRNLKVKPYFTGSMSDSRTPTPPTAVVREYTYDGGVDMKYSLTQSITLDATYHTDFSQVEADQQQTNLTRFNVFFAEKRDFFLENAGIFNFGGGGAGAGNSNNLIPFYSRRIGLNCTSDNSGCTPVPILGGSRVSGKAGRFDIGFLTMKTKRSEVAASNNFVVGRVKRNLLNNSWLGLLFTHRNSSLPGDTNQVYGTDAHLQFYQKLEIDAYLMKSNTPDKAQRRYQGDNMSRRLETAWRDDDWNISAEVDQIQRNFNPEVGFARRRDFTKYSSEAGWRPRPRNSRIIRNFNLSGLYDYFEGLDGRLESRNNNYTLGVSFQDSSAVNFNINNTFDRLKTATRISGATVAAGSYQYQDYAAGFNTNRSRPYSVSGSLGWGEFWNGRRKIYSTTLGLKPDYHLNMELSYSRNAVRMPGSSFNTDLVGVRTLYAFTSRMFLNALVQYNTDNRQVTSNIRFNFTHRPLSDIYLVYNDRRDARSGELVERAFIVKVTNLFNF